MTKLLLTGLLSAISLFSYAEDTVIFRFTDGTEQSVGADNLIMTIVEGSIIASNGEQNFTFPLESLQKFYFSSNSGDNSLGYVAEDASSLEAFSLDGMQLGKYQSLDECRKALRKGTYIIKSGCSSYKISFQ